MDTILIIVGICVLGFVVNVALKQSYNFLFFFRQKPLWWIVSVAVIAIAVWAVSAIAGWGVSVPTWACTIAFFMNLPPGQKSAEEKREVRELVDEAYADMGMKHGRRLHRLGLAVFVFSCVGSWVIFYGEVCSGGECRRIASVFQSYYSGDE